MKLHHLIPLLLLTTHLTAQGYLEGANLTYEYLPLKTQTPQGNQTFTAQNIKASATIPIFLKPDRSQYLLIGAGVEAFTFPDASALNTHNLYSLSPTLGYGARLTDKFTLMALLLPTLGSDFKNISGRDILFGGVMRGTWKANDNLSWRALVGYRGQFYGPQYIVLLGMDWKMGDRWRLFGDVPSSATLRYAVNPKVNAGLDVFVQTSTYRLEDRGRYIDYNATVPGLFAEYYVAPKWAVRATVGYAVPRDLEVYEKADKFSMVDFVELGDRLGPVGSVEGGWCLRVGVGYRVATWK